MFVTTEPSGTWYSLEGLGRPIKIKIEVAGKVDNSGVPHSRIVWDCPRDIRIKRLGWQPGDPIPKDGVTPQPGPISGAPM